jgi:hypothetical protein
MSCHNADNLEYVRGGPRPNLRATTRFPSCWGRLRAHRRLLPHRPAMADDRNRCGARDAASSALVASPKLLLQGTERDTRGAALCGARARPSFSRGSTRRTLRVGLNRARRALKTTAGFEVWTRRLGPERLWRGQLIVVSAASNRSKGDKGPEQWKPPRKKAWCLYSRWWVQVKRHWQLTVVKAERTELREMVATC